MTNPVSLYDERFAKVLNRKRNLGNSFSGKIYGKVNMQRENKTGEGVIRFFVGQLNTSNKQLTSSRSCCYVTG